MSSSRSEGYKRYLEPGSEEPIPPSSWFRYKKLCTQQSAALKQLGQYYTLSITIKKFMDPLLTYEAGMKYTFQGRGQKKLAFKNLLTFRVLFNAVTSHYPSETAANVEKWIKDWLTQCKSQQERALNKA
ncbi:uncharacterized protein LOC117182301 [Belonocnema kinseyi]|uniref:uncharacterized protein LOC117182301 n=1 Tax=Belonocnema kinseyi TaxID=2817044 RepID=UPI00143D9A07|nr:uncharacterized protein LOC117182301 [Belonocnema kinseyi]XP_033231332.1 uncharacterized protein LOC117182301 [Belonocnema kinseyi]XP_033231333.1 uncharacterized protein LOC117182301 [Belonocnema kinseyi]